MSAATKMRVRVAATSTDQLHDIAAKLHDLIGDQVDAAPYWTGLRAVNAELDRRHGGCVARGRCGVCARHTLAYGTDEHRWHHVDPVYDHDVVPRNITEVS